MNKNTKRTIIRVIVLAIAGIIIGVGIYNLNAKNLIGDSMPMPLGIGASVVLSGSMEPELFVDDLIIVKSTDNLYEGQVVVFRDGSSLTVHRIVKINGDEITTKGDANNTEDSPIDRSMIKGEVIYVIRGVGDTVELLQNPIFTVIALALAFFLMESSFRKERESEQEELIKIKEEIEKMKNE